METSLLFCRFLMNLRCIALFTMCLAGLLSSNRLMANVVSEGIRFSIQQQDSLVVVVDTLVANAADFNEIQAVPKDSLRRKKFIAAVMALPFPFGFVGAHRVMMGTAPWIPIVYIATFGGCFGLLPLIDFCAIVFSKDYEQFENNPHVFMWMK